MYITCRQKSRHPDISPRKLENLDRRRANMSTTATVDIFFTLLSALLNEHGIKDKPSQVNICYNINITFRFNRDVTEMVRYHGHLMNFVLRSAARIPLTTTPEDRLFSLVVKSGTLLVRSLMQLHLILKQNLQFSPCD